ncbi:hypothetical protein FQA47_025601 [Oryzias melastigma]|uniref:Uncharacterized protein n=1 Tax=Oryzias melastigma TaxID=30732 RepID=A0A834FBL6_ORYME|nr:hypothetical protein FQA47_025601 [Oryzias melastigma]
MEGGKSAGERRGEGVCSARMAEAVRRQLWRGDGQDSAPASSFPFSSERARVRPAPAAAQAVREGGGGVDASERVSAPTLHFPGVRAARRHGVSNTSGRRGLTGCHGAARAPLVRRRDPEEGARERRTDAAAAAFTHGGETQRVRRGSVAATSQ